MVKDDFSAILCLQMRGLRQGKPNGGVALAFKAGVATLCALAVALAAPIGAQAATEIGQTPPPPSQTGSEPSMLPTLCPSGINLVQSKTGAAPGYDVPANGVITSWRHRGATVAEETAGQAKLVVWRPAGTDKYTVVGKSAKESFTPNTLSPALATRVPVKAGDLLGLRTETDGVACFFSNFEQSSMEDEVRFQGSGGAPSGGGGGGGGTGSACVDSGGDQRACQDEFCDNTFAHAGFGEDCKSFPSSSANAADPADGSTQTFDPVPGSGGRVNVSAIVEPDADADGFGDETQDLCPTDASTAGTCPPPPAPKSEAPGPPPDLTPPELAVFGNESQPLRKVIRVAAVCPTQACEVFATGRLIVKPPARKRSRGPRRIRGFKLGPASAAMAAGEKKALRLKIRKPAQKAAAKALRQGGQVRALVRVRAIDESGNDTYARKGVSLGKNPNKARKSKRRR